MVSFGPNVVVTVWTVLSGWIPLPSWTVVTRNGTRGGGGGGWATGGGGGGGGGSSFLQPERTNSDRPTRAAFRSIGVPRLWRDLAGAQALGIFRTWPGWMRSGLPPTT